jgi:hypothetical protein
LGADVDVDEHEGVVGAGMGRAEVEEHDEVEDAYEQGEA